jgi:hypothetical protein
MTDSRLERIIETLQLRDIRVVWDRLMRVKYDYLKLQEEEAAAAFGDNSDDEESQEGDFDRASSFHSWGGEGEDTVSRKMSMGAVSPMQRSATVGHLAPTPVMASTSSKTPGASFAPSTKLDFLSPLPDANPNIQSRRNKKIVIPPIFGQLLPGFYIEPVDFPELEPEAPLTVIHRIC